MPGMGEISEVIPVAQLDDRYFFYRDGTVLRCAYCQQCALRPHDPRTVRHQAGCMVKASLDGEPVSEGSGGGRRKIGRKR